MLLKSWVHLRMISLILKEQFFGNRFFGQAGTPQSQGLDYQICLTKDKIARNSCSEKAIESHSFAVTSASVSLPPKNRSLSLRGAGSPRKRIADTSCKSSRGESARRVQTSLRKDSSSEEQVLSVPEKG